MLPGRKKEKERCDLKWSPSFNPAKLSHHFPFQQRRWRETWKGGGWVKDDSWQSSPVLASAWTHSLGCHWFFCVLTAVVQFSSQTPVNIYKNISLFIVFVCVRFELLQVSAVSCDLLNISGQKHQAECKTRCMIKKYVCATFVRERTCCTQNFAFTRGRPQNNVCVFMWHLWIQVWFLWLRTQVWWIREDKW